MKKNILLILLFITMFFIGNNDVYALKCKQGDKGCTDLAEVKDSINKEINAKYDMARIACLYEVELDDGNIYYNYIFYSAGSDKIYGATTKGSLDEEQVLQSNDNAWLLGDAYDNLYKNNQCPAKSYIDTNGTNEICFDNDDGSCKNNGEKLNTGTDFNKTISSNRVENNADAIKYKNLTWKTSCSKEYLPEEYADEKVCRYRATEGDEYILLLYNGSKSQLIYNNMEGIKIIVDGGENVIKTTTIAYQGSYTYDYNYQNKIPKTINSCPNYIYYNSYGMESDTSGFSFKYNYAWELEKGATANTTKRFQNFSCINNNVISPDESVYESCGQLINSELQEIINNIMTIIRIAVPILLIGLLTYDFSMAVIHGSDDKVGKIKGRVFKRIIIAIVIFFVPTLINIVFNLVNDVWGTNFETCGIAQNTE